MEIKKKVDEKCSPIEMESFGKSKAPITSSGYKLPKLQRKNRTVSRGEPRDAKLIVFSHRLFLFGCVFPRSQATIPLFILTKVYRLLGIKSGYNSTYCVMQVSISNCASSGNRWTKYMFYCHCWYMVLIYCYAAIVLIPFVSYI